jgi:hypothetical protein
MSRIPAGIRASGIFCTPAWFDQATKKRGGKSLHAGAQAQGSITSGNGSIPAHLRDYSKGDGKKLL